MSVRRESHPTPEAAAEACARKIARLVEETLTGREFATLAVSGGGAAKLLFDRIVPLGIVWNRVHLFWVDERVVPPGDAESNYRLAEERLILPAHLPRRNVHRVRGESPPEDAARAYAAEIRAFFMLSAGETPRFDVVHQGMGPDGHTASLFPGEPLIAGGGQIAAAVYSPKLPQWRVTLLPAVLLAARHTVFLATGAGKAEAVRATLRGIRDPSRCPAQIASATDVTWFLDERAAALLD